MKRIWLLTLGFVVAIFLLLAMGSWGGPRLLLTAAAPVGAGIAAAFLPGTRLLARGIWLFVGVLLGGLGYVFGALFMTDDSLGLAIGACIPVVLLALMTMWTRRESNQLAGMLGAGSVTAVYAYQFNLDPQSLNVSLPIALGQTALPIGMGFIAGVLIAALVRPDPKAADAPPDTAPPAAPSDAPAGAVGVTA